jgi:hypothetical protein
VRICSKPECLYKAVATLTFNYSKKLARLGHLSVKHGLGEYDLCPKHAQRLSAPKTWRFEKLVQEFPEPELAPKTSQAPKLPAQNTDTSLTSAVSSQKKSLRERARANKKLQEAKRKPKNFPDDDLTALMRSVRENYSSPVIPALHQGTKRRNLVAVRTGETSQTIPEVSHDK